MKTIVFDLGNVLVDVDFRKLYNALNLEHHTYEEFMLLIEKDAILYNKGDLSPQQFHQNLIESLSLDLSYPDFMKMWCCIFKKNELLYNFAASINKENAQVIIASNTDPVHYSYIKSKFGLGFVDKEFLSYSERCVKPDLEYFQKLLRVYDIDLGNTIFIDDNYNNINAAKEVGFKVILNNDNRNSLDQLKRFLE